MLYISLIFPSIYLSISVYALRSEVTFHYLPFHYIEIALLLLTNAKEDIPHYNTVSTLIQDLENIRIDRARLGLFSVSDEISNGNAVDIIGLTNIACGEIQSLKSIFINSTNLFKKFTDNNDGSDNSNMNNTQENSISYTSSTTTPAPATPINQLRSRSRK